MYFGALARHKNLVQYSAQQSVICFNKSLIIYCVQISFTENVDPNIPRSERQHHFLYMYFIVTHAHIYLSISINIVH